MAEHEHHYFRVAEKSHGENTFGQCRCGAQVFVAAKPWPDKCILPYCICGGYRRQADSSVSWANRPCDLQWCDTYNGYHPVGQHSIHT